MQITKAFKSFFISIVFFSSLAQAQIPDEVVFHDSIVTNIFSTSFAVGNKDYVFDGNYKQKPFKYSWNEIQRMCDGYTVNGYCDLYLFEGVTPSGKSYKAKYRLNISTGDFVALEWLGGQATSNIRFHEINYELGNKLVKSISLTGLNFGSYNNLPIVSVNYTKHNVTYNWPTFGHHTCSLPGPSTCEFSTDCWVLTGKIDPYSWSSSVLNSSSLYGIALWGLQQGPSYVYVTDTQDCTEGYVGDINFDCKRSETGVVNCKFTVQNIPNSGYQLSYKNQIFEINYAPPSLSIIPNQTITANKPFSLDLKSYLSKIVDGAPEVTMTVTPSDLAGLHFDADNMTLSGRPSSTGSYQFTVNAKSTLGGAAPITFMVHIGVNQDDKPEWKPMAELPGATVEVGYDFDMNRLLAHAAGVVEFKIAESFPHPKWLRIENGHLVGTPTVNDAGTTQQVTLFAESATGGSATNAQGDPEPLTLSIPIQQDGRLRPTMQSLEKRVGANESIRFDLRDLVNDPTNDPNLQIVLDKVEPLNEQLTLSINQSTVLEGLIPSDNPGQTFQLSLHAHNTQGGDSEPALVNLKVEINPMYKPTFNGAKPTLPILIPGTPFFHDFQESNDVRPERIPFTIKFAEGYPHPSWLQIENNQLKADKVPDDIFNDVDFHVVIENIPGGRSEVFHLFILAMD